jgi:hypothetical protein
MGSRCTRPEALGLALRRPRADDPDPMDRRTRNLFVLALALLVIATGGMAVLLNGAGASSGSATAPSIVGVIVGVRSEGLDKVRAFSLRAADGSIVEFTIGALENGASFPPGHLVEHQATAQPVRVWYQTDGATRVAIRLEDAP